MKTSNNSAKGGLFLTKMQGAGNSFLITLEKVEVSRRPLLAKQLCDMHFGIGADGVVFLSAQNDNNLEWDFYNSDGSEAEFCGNAARCVAQYMHSVTGNKNSLEIKTRAGTVRCQVMSENRVEVQMPTVKWMDAAMTVPLWPNPVAWLNTGVPHVVMVVPHIDDLTRYKTEAAHIRSWSGLGPGGANVTFIYIHNEDTVSANSYERGVEDFTLACGTGAVAAAVFMMKRSGKSSCKVRMPGGELNVALENEKVLMTGEAHKVADVEFLQETKI
jgi:diaminopimelate epimerase